MAIPREKREKLQLEAVRIAFQRMRNRIPALKKLADRQGVEAIDRIEDVLPVCFDHRVLSTCWGRFTSPARRPSGCVKGGRIINFSSSLAKYAIAGAGLYAAARSAVESFTESW